jgi:hypothetical protein
VYVKEHSPGILYPINVCILGNKQTVVIQALYTISYSAFYTMPVNFWQGMEWTDLDCMVFIFPALCMYVLEILWNTERDLC